MEPQNSRKEALRKRIGNLLKASNGEALEISSSKFEEILAEVKSYHRELEPQEVIVKDIYKKLEASNSQISNILSSISDAFFALDNDFVVTYFNNSAERVLNRKAGDVLGKPLFDSFPEAQGSIFEKEYKLAMIEKVARNFETYFPVQPYENWYEVRVYPQENGITVYFRVITERKNLERKIADHQLVMSDILESTLSGYWDWNLQANTEYLSPTFKRMFGYDDCELPNSPETWQKLICQEDLQGVLDVYEKHVQSKGRIPYYNEVRYKHKNGSTVWVICAGRVIEWANDGTPIRMVGCHVDITKQKRMEEQLRLEKIKLKAKNKEYLTVNEKLIRANEGLRVASEKLTNSELRLKEQVEEYTALNEELNQSNEELRSTMEELNESNLRAKALVAANPDLMFVYNHEGVFLDYHSPSMDDLLVKPENFLSKKVDEVLPAQIAALNQQAINNLFKTGQTQNFSYSFDVNGKLSHFDARMVKYGHNKALAIVRDVTEQRQAFEEREVTIRLFTLINAKNNTENFLREVLHLMKDWSACQSVGIRLKDGDDFPYFVTEGFNKDFVEAEKYLCAVDDKGLCLKNSLGNPILECMCGNVLQERFNPSQPFFTENGSFWTNSTSELASAFEADCQAKTRNRCNGEGYESVALIPIKKEGEVFGLLQFNDKQRNKFSREMISFLERLAGNLSTALAEKKVRIELAQSEEKFRKITENISDVVWTCDLNLQTTYVSPSVVNLVGEPVEKQFQRTMEEKHPPESLKIFYSIFAEELEREKDPNCDKNRSQILEVERYRADGSIMWISMNVTFIRDASGKAIGLQGVSRDITNRKLAEKALQQSEERFKMLFEKAPIGYQSLDENGCFLEVNETWLNLLGYTKDEVIGRWFGNFLAPKYAEGFKKRFPIFKAQGHIHSEFVMVKKDGARIFIAFDGRIGYTLKGEFKQTHCTLNDITEQRNAEQALKESEEKYRMLVENQNDLVVKVDVKGQFQYVSPSYCSIFGKTEGNLLGSSFFPLVHPDDVERTQLEMAKLNSYPYTCQIEQRAMTKGGWRWFSWSNTAELNEKGDVVSIIGVGRDITVQKQVEQALRDSEEKYRMLFDANKDGIAIFLINPDGMPSKFVEANFSAGQMIGYTKDELKSLSPSDLEHDISLEVVNDRISKIKTTGIAKFEAKIKHKDGHFVYVDVSAIVINYQNQPAILNITRNISERKKDEEAIRKQEERIKSIFRVAPTGIGVVKDRVFVEINPQLCEMTGYSSEELVGKSARILYPTQKEYDFVGAEKYQQISEKGTGIVETRWVRKDGAVIDIILSSTPITVNDLTQGITFTAMDITQRKSIEQALRAEEKRYRLLFENMTQGFALHEMIYDENGIPYDYRFLSVNPAFERLTGLKSENLIGKTVLEVLPNTELYWIETYGKVAQTQEAIKYENYSQELRKYYDVSAFSPKWGQFAVVFTDITNRKLAEEKVLKLSKGIEQSPAIVVITDINGTIEYVNSMFTEVTGYSAEEALGQNPRILKSNSHNLLFYQNLWATILNGSDWRGEIQNKKKNGELYWESALISPIKNDRGEVINFIAIKQDITEKKQIEEVLITSELKLKEQNEEYLALNEELLESNERISKINIELVTAREKAEESDRLKTAFLANMSHEIRTPMNAIIGFSEVLLKPTLSPGKQQFYTSVLNEACQQLLTVVNDVIDIAKVETKQVKVYQSEVDINKLLQKAYSIFSTNAEKKGNHISLHMGLPDSDCAIVTDETKLSQIINNLLSNAIKFTNEGNIEMGYSVENHSVKFYVKDTGIGISPEHHSIVFERFRQVEVEDSRKYGGTGLGLSISKAFVELMGGQIWLESSLGSGAAFYFTIPFMPSKKRVAEPILSSAGKFNLNNRTILLAEDEHANYLLINNWLEEANAKVIYAANGHEAVSMFEKNPEVDLVLMDIKMPLMNGLEATKVIKAINSKVPIIALTAYAMAGDKEKCLAAGCNNYLSKPIKRQELFSLIATYLA